MSMEATIRSRLAPLAATHIALDNESHKHAVPAGSTSHWRALIVSPAFEGQRLVARQRAVYGLLQAELANGIHALALRTLTPAEWAAEGGGLPATPPCHGGTGL